MEPQDDQGGYSYIDYSEKRSLPISIPDYNTINRNGERYITFNIHMAGRQLVCRRYREFANLHAALKKEFTGFNFPKLPGKWPFQLSEQQLDARRRGLEQYLEKVCAIRVIAESECMQDFLTDSEDDLASSPVDIKIMLPDHEVATVSIRKSANAQQVWDLLVQRAKLTSYTQQYFYLFEIVEYNFGTQCNDNDEIDIFEFRLQIFFVSFQNGNFNRMKFHINCMFKIIARLQVHACVFDGGSFQLIAKKRYHMANKRQSLFFIR